MRYLLLSLLAGLAACQSETTEPSAGATTPSEPAEAIVVPVVDEGLAAVLDAQPDEVKARYKYRNPQQTLEFFGIESGMTVVEGYPGGGWYTKILMQHLGPDGTLLAANYDLEIFPLIWDDADWYAEQAAWADNWPERTSDWGGESGASTRPFYLGSMPDDLAGTADAVFFSRVIHNLVRFQNAGEGEFYDAALADVFKVLKPGGVFGIVQHRAPDDKSDKWADGNRGYLKQQFVIDSVEAAGFEFVEASDINLNPKDQPGRRDDVWRLPPSFGTSNNDRQRAKFAEIGESSRMTLKFVKPAE